MHERIYSLDCAWAQHLERSHLPKDIFRHYAQCGKALSCLERGFRSLALSEHKNTAVVRCTLRDHGIALAGPSPATLVDPIPVAVLRQEIVDSNGCASLWAEG